MRAAFVGMQGRIDPPSSLGDLTVERLSQTASEAEVWGATTKAQTTEFGLIVGTVILTRSDLVLEPSLTDAARCIDGCKVQ
jgi:hypothetical protein